MKTFSQVAIALVGMTGLVAAQPKADPKAADPKMAPKAEPNKGEPNKADPKAAGGMAEMKPPQELADLAKAAAGTWKCKGQGMDHSMKMQDMAATMKIKLDLANWWIHGSFESKMGKEPFQFESFTTYDPAAKKWKRVMIETGGGWSTGESAGLKDNKVDWELMGHSAMGEFLFRDHEDMSDPKAGAKFWGEFSMDKGKTWTKVYEMTCKK
ncbi:MAG TPA: hypothetical protein VHN14_00245 [Kofleriaceae bacterium]|jgi:hypothetical protein|nr:hypothetical protein [Kofleriaceae bacterium]